ncbi:MAG: hypothetical protein ACREQ1_12825, partial [Woeseiaceae bacterium]
MSSQRFAILLCITIVPLVSTAQSYRPEERIVQMLDEARPFHVVTKSLFDELGWDLPDDGRTVQALADAAPGGAFDPRGLETIAKQQLGYTANWHEVRFKVYGLDWDIGALHLVPAQPVAALPTLAIINGGAANWYEFFVDPRNRAGLGQYLAQRIPVLLITIPGNYRHGGWTETDFSQRIPAYVLDREISRDEAALRNAVFTFRVISQGIAAAIDEVVSGPDIITGHSTGGEVQFLLKEPLADRLQSLSLGWGTGGPAGLEAMREFRGRRSMDDYPHVSRLRARTPEQYA